MSAYLIFTFIFAAAVLVFCYVLTRYWFGTGRHMPEQDVGKLRFGSKTAFALTHFWKAVDDAKELPSETVKSGMGSAAGITAEDRSGPVLSDGGRKPAEVSNGYVRRKYRLKENM